MDLYQKTKKFVKATAFGGLTALAIGCIYEAPPNLSVISGVVKSEDYRPNSFLDKAKYSFSVLSGDNLIIFKCNNPRKLNLMLSEGDSVKIRPRLREMDGDYLINEEDILEVNGRRLR